MLDINIFGSYEFADLPNIGVTELPEGDIYATLVAFVAAENVALRQFISGVADFGTNIQDQMGGVAGGQLQRIGEHSGPEATRGGAKWTTAFPIAEYGDRSLYTPQYLNRASLADLNAQAVEKVLKDINTMYHIVFEALTGNANYTYNDNEWPGKNTGQYTIRRLANNDGQVGSAYYNGSAVALATSQHYITSGNATYNKAAFTTAFNKLRNVGNGGSIVHIVSKNDALLLQAALTTDYVPVPQQNISVLPTTQTPIVESPAAVGVVRDAGEVQAWPHWPDGYIFSYDRTKPKPVRIRESVVADERGFQLATDETRAGEIPGRPLLNKYWRRIAGAGVRNRFNGVVTQITTSGTYTVPTLP